MSDYDMVGWVALATFTIFLFGLCPFLPLIGAYLNKLDEKPNRNKGDLT